MPDILVDPKKPLTIGTLTVDEKPDAIVLRSTLGNHTQTGTFKTEHYTMKNVVEIESASGVFPVFFAKRSISGGSDMILEISQDVRDAYERAVADGKIDEAEQAQFRELEKTLYAIDVAGEQSRNHGLKTEALLPLDEKAQAVAR